jgi:adenosylmethionine-8-amino-7-oxononanoate aminotransferase
MKEIRDEDKAYVWHPFSPFLGMPDVLPVSKGEGAYLVTEDGRKILDAVSSWWVNLHGHANPKIAAAVAGQAHQLEQVIFAGFTHAPAVDLSKRLLKLLPSNQSRVFFSDDGSTAIEVALKLTLQYWFNRGEERKKVIAIEGAYHGDTFGAMSVGERDVFVKPFENYLFEVLYLPFPTSDNVAHCLAKMKEYATMPDTGAFIFEPLVQGAAGMRMYGEDTLEELLRIAKSNQLITIADEVMTGFGRLGKNFATDFIQGQPDLICLSKGLTGGFLPMGVTTVSTELVDAFWTSDAKRSFLHGHSYTANPLACAAALASLDILLSKECQERIEKISKCHAAFVSKIANHPRVADARSKGTILALELITDEATGYFNTQRHKLYEYFLEKDILLRPLGNIIYVLPPYVITEHELQRIYQAIEAYLNSKD